MIEFTEVLVGMEGSFTIPETVNAVELVYPPTASVYSFLLRVPFRFEAGKLVRSASVMHVSWNAMTREHDLEFFDAEGFR